MSMAAGAYDSHFHAAVTTAAQVSAVPIDIGSYHILNLTAAVAYIQVFYKLAANVTLGTTVADFHIPLPASGGATLNFGGSGWRTRGPLTLASTTDTTGSTTAASFVSLYKCR